MKKKYKYQYWTYITKVGDSYKKEMKVGNLISYSYKKESFLMFNFKTGEEKFMCCGIYIGRTLADLDKDKKFDLLEQYIDKNAEVLKFMMDNGLKRVKKRRKK